MRFLAQLTVAAAVLMPTSNALASESDTPNSVTPRASVMTNKPVDSAKVFWVGHSLIEARVEAQLGTLSLMTLIGHFARAKKLGYDYGDHTLWGSSLSTLWNGKAHGYPRQAEEMKRKRQIFQNNTSNYNTLVMTELLPIAWSSKAEFTTLYMRKFACEVLRKNPQARIYLYQGWTDLQKDEDDKVHQDLASHSKWLDTIASDRTIWQSLATAARDPKVPAPSLLSRVGFHSKSNGGCDTKLSVSMIPVADVLVALRHELSGPRAGSYKLPERSAAEDRALLRQSTPATGHPDRQTEQWR